MIDRTRKFYEFPPLLGAKKPPIFRFGEFVQFEKISKQWQLGPNLKKMIEDDKAGKDMEWIWTKLHNNNVKPM